MGTFKIWLHKIYTKWPAICIAATYWILSAVFEDWILKQIKQRWDLDFLEFIARNPSVIGGIVLLFVGFWAYEQTKKDVVKRSLVDTLTEMHRCLIELQEKKASQNKIEFRQFEKVTPLLADAMGVVSLKDWTKFKRGVKRRIRQASPRRRPSSQELKKYGLRKRWWEIKKYKEKVEQAGLFVASQVREELLQSKNWGLDDGIRISDWLDKYSWGITDCRDNDEQWESLRKSINHYFVDTELRNLIDRHIEASRFFNSSCLMVHYSKNFPKSSFAGILRDTLVGSPISPSKMEIALSEILSDIEKRLAEIQEEKRPDDN